MLAPPDLGASPAWVPVAVIPFLCPGGPPLGTSKAPLSKIKKLTLDWRGVRRCCASGWQGSLRKVAGGQAACYGHLDCLENKTVINFEEERKAELSDGLEGKVRRQGRHAFAAGRSSFHIVLLSSPVTSSAMLKGHRPCSATQCRQPPPHRCLLSHLGTSQLPW